MHTATLLHAEVIIADLLETVLDRTEFPLTLSKLEGGGAFLYVTLDADAGGDARAVAQDVLRHVTAFIDAFKTRERELIACDAYTRLGYALPEWITSCPMLSARRWR